MCEISEHLNAFCVPCSLNTITSSIYTYYFNKIVIIIPAATEDFKDDYGHSDDYSLSDVLWTCSSMLSNRYPIKLIWNL